MESHEYQESTVQSMTNPPRFICAVTGCGHIREHPIHWRPATDAEVQSVIDEIANGKLGDPNI